MIPQLLIVLHVTDQEAQCLDSATFSSSSPYLSHHTVQISSSVYENNLGPFVLYSFILVKFNSLTIPAPNAAVLRRRKIHLHTVCSYSTPLWSFTISSLICWMVNKCLQCCQRLVRWFLANWVSETWTGSFPQATVIGRWLLRILPCAEVSWSPPQFFSLLVLASYNQCVSSQPLCRVQEPPYTCAE